MTIRKIRSRLTDGTNYCCQSNVGPTSAALPGGAAQVSGRRAFHYCPASVTVTSHQAECVACPVLAACDTAHLPQDPGPGVLQAGGGFRKVPLERVHPSLMHPTNQCSSYPGALRFTCQCVCVCESHIRSDRSQHAIKKELNRESGDGVCSQLHTVQKTKNII